MQISINGRLKWGFNREVALYLRLSNVFGYHGLSDNYTRHRAVTGNTTYMNNMCICPVKIGLRDYG